MVPPEVNVWCAVQGRGYWTWLFCVPVALAQSLSVSELHFPSLGTGIITWPVSEDGR